MSFVLGLTGPTGAGKSSANKIAQALGFKIVDCDLLARKAVEKGTDGLSAVTVAFGSDVLSSDGTLNRSALAKKAFATKESTELLNKTLLPHIARLVYAEIDAPLVLLDAPTLFESGLDSICSATIAVLADEAVRLERIMKRDGIDKASALLRMSAGKGDDYYLARANHIVYNNSTNKEFELKIKQLLENIAGGIL